MTKMHYYGIDVRSDCTKYIKFSVCTIWLGQILALLFYAIMLPKQYRYEILGHCMGRQTLKKRKKKNSFMKYYKLMLNTRYICIDRYYIQKALALHVTVLMKIK